MVQSEGFEVVDGVVKKAEIQTNSGIIFDLLNPDPEKISLDDIAHSLAMQCRFNGHFPFFYSVATHSILATTLAMQDRIFVDVLRAVLMHDAAEAYAGDMIRPLKDVLPQFKAIYKGVEAAVGKRFGIDFDAYKHNVSYYDDQMLEFEQWYRHPLTSLLRPGECPNNLYSRLWLFELMSTAECHRPAAAAAVFRNMAKSLGIE